MGDCKTCKHKGTNTHVCDECTSDYGMYEKKIITNADRIRSMSDSELAEWLATIDHYWDDGESIVNFGGVRMHDSKEDILDWLKEEVERNV